MVVLRLVADTSMGVPMDIPERIAGLDARKVRELFKTFAEQKSELDWKDGMPVSVIQRMTTNVISKGLGLSQAEADRVQTALMAEGWIDQEKLTPTRKGMGLAQHIDRPKISRADAQVILGKVLEWADSANAEVGARVKVKAIHLYGSLARGADQVDDIDLFVEFTTMDLEMDLQPEDMEREHELCEDLSAISDRLSPSSAIDRMMMDDVPMQRVFPPLD